MKNSTSSSHNGMMLLIKNLLCVLTCLHKKSHIMTKKQKKKKVFAFKDHLLIAICILKYIVHLSIHVFPPFYASNIIEER